MVNKYKKGYIDASDAYAKFDRKQGKAIQYILEEVRKGNKSMAQALKELKNNIGELYDYLDAKEKESLYSVYTPFDLRELGKEERLFVVGAIFTLSKDQKPTENQQAYFRAVMKYLGVKEPPKNTILSGINNIADIESQKGIFQVIIEYLSLKAGAFYDETLEQFDFLEKFQLNEESKKSLISCVENMYIAVGKAGLIEKYEYWIESPDPLYEEEIEKEQEPLSIPLLRHPVTIVYENKNLLSEQMAELLMGRIYEKVTPFNIECEIGKCSNVEYKKDMADIERESHVIFIGIPDEAKALSKNIKWEYDNLGMKYGTEGRKSIITVSKLKGNEYTDFMELVKREREKLRGVKIPDGVEDSEFSFFKELYDDVDVNDSQDVIVHVLASIVCSPLLFFGGMLDLVKFGIQGIKNISAKDAINQIQYTIIVEKFMEYNIDSYLC